VARLKEDEDSFVTSQALQDVTLLASGKIKLKSLVKHPLFSLSNNPHTIS